MSVKIFAETVEESAKKQIERLSNAYNDSKIRIMPDCHAGAGCTIGTTMTLDGKVTPNLVGVDICCAMLAVQLKTPKKGIEFEKLDKVIRAYVPSGFNIRDTAIEECEFLEDLRCKNRVDLRKASRSIGTLGGGNHFIELDYEESSKTFWLVIHTGSRNLGLQVCRYYQDLAIKKLTDDSEIKRRMIEEIRNRCISEGRKEDIESELRHAFDSIERPAISKELAYLEGEDYEDYIHDMTILKTYSHLNREVIARVIMKEMKWKEQDRFETYHNYIDTDKMILRKGAISADLGERVLVPMNMRDGSLICTGKGNEDWNFSGPHGAGRLMSRGEARERVPMKEFRDSMKGIYTTSISPVTVDESPMVYKPMDEIIRCIEPTLDVVSIIKPVYNFKAGEEETKDNRGRG